MFFAGPCDTGYESEINLLALENGNQNISRLQGNLD